MGCDIHCYVEYKSPDYDGWRPFGERINPGRDYGLFTDLAGVRNYGDAKPAVEPRGAPADMAYPASGDWWLWINDEFADEENYCSLAKALEWSKYGSKIEERDGKPCRVEHPDWHSASWLTVDEFDAALNKPRAWPSEDSYWALLAAMRCLQERGNEVRIVFWFDN